MKAFVIIFTAVFISMTAMAAPKVKTTGASTDWYNPLSWDSGVVPTAGTDIQISHNINLDLVSDVIVNSVLFSWPSSSVDLSVTNTGAFTFTVTNGVVSKGSNSTLTIGNGVNFSTSDYSNNQANFVVGDNANVTISGDVSNSGDITVGDNSTMAIGDEFRSTAGSIDIGIDNTITVGGDLTFSGGGTNVDVGLGTSFDVSGDMVVTAGVNVLNIAGDFTAESLAGSGGSQEINILSGGSFSANSDVTFSGSAGFDIFNGGVFDIGGGMTITGGASGTVDGVLTVTNNLHLATGTSIVGTGTVVAGSYSGGGTIFGVVANTIGNGTVLPIDLVYFNVTANGGLVNISWQTGSEENNDYFTIERSVNGVDFEPIAKVFGAGNSSIEIDYGYVDNNPLAGVSYYRLRQTDYDGGSMVFDVVSVTRNNSEFSEVEIINNDGIITYDLGTDFSGVVVEVFSSFGTLELKNNVGEVRTFSTNVNGVSSNVVIIRVYDGVNLNSTTKILK